MIFDIMTSEAQVRSPERGVIHISRYDVRCWLGSKKCVGKQAKHPVTIEAQRRSFELGVYLYLML